MLLVHRRIHQGDQECKQKAAEAQRAQSRIGRIVQLGDMIHIPEVKEPKGQQGWSGPRFSVLVTGTQQKYALGRVSRRLPYRFRHIFDTGSVFPVNYLLMPAGWNHSHSSQFPREVGVLK